MPDQGPAAENEEPDVVQAVSHEAGAALRPVSQESTVDRVTDEIRWLSASDEEDYAVAQANAPITASTSSLVIPG